MIAIIGESCTGKTTLAQMLKEKLNAQVFAGKDYLRLAKNEAIAKKLFQKTLKEAVTGEHILYVITEIQHLDLLPDGAIRILVTAEMETIKERFAKRMGGTLPAPVADMLERKHGCFDAEPHDYHVVSGQTNMEKLIHEILSR